MSIQLAYQVNSCGSGSVYWLLWLFLVFLSIDPWPYLPIRLTTARIFRSKGSSPFFRFPRFGHNLVDGILSVNVCFAYERCWLQYGIDGFWSRTFQKILKFNPVVRYTTYHLLFFIASTSTIKPFEPFLHSSVFPFSPSTVDIHFILLISGGT